MKKSNPRIITVAKLRKSSPENVRRLARALKLRIDGFSHGHVCRLVYWRVTRPAPSRHGDYADMLVGLFD